MSNCLIQAIKQKLFYPMFKVYYLKPYKKDGLPHFCWWNPYKDSYEHYTFKGKKPWWKLLWFKGYIDNFPYERTKVKLIRIL